MKPKHDDFWDNVLAFINEAHDECTKMAKRGKLGDFETDWHDPVANVSKHRWFADTKAVAKKVAEKSIRIEVKNMVEYYRFAERLLGSDFG